MRVDTNRTVPQGLDNDSKGTRKQPVISRYKNRVMVQVSGSIPLSATKC